MKSLAALDRPSWLSSSAWPWQPYLLSHHQGGIAVTDIGYGPAVVMMFAVILTACRIVRSVSCVFCR